MSKHAPGVICRVKPPRPPAISQAEYDQTNERFVELVELMYREDGSRGWTITPELKVTRHLAKGITMVSSIYAIVETALIPLNPGEGQDEILRIAGLPVKETA